MATIEQLKDSIDELNKGLKELENAAALLDDLKKSDEQLERLNTQMRTQLKNSALLVNGTLDIYETIRREQDKLKLALRDQTADLQKRLNIYAEEIASRLSEWEKNERREREAERRQRADADDAAIKAIQDKLRKTQREAKRDMTVVKVMIAVFGSVAIALPIILWFIL